MNKKNILFISSWFPNKLEPNNGNFVQRHAEAVSTVHDVEILHAIGDQNQSEKFLLDEQTINGIRTLIVYYKNTKNPMINFLRRMEAYKKGFRKMKKPDLVHANILHNSMFFAVWLKKRFKIPFVVTEHWTALRKINQEITPAKIKRTAKIIGNRANCIMPVSDDLKKGLENIGISTPMKVVPNVVNTELFHINLESKKAFTFLHVSSLIPRKNAEKILTVAIQLLEKGHQFRLELGGDGEKNVIETLRKQVQDSGFEHKIEIFEMQTLQQIAERMKNADCFILYSDDENQPCVIAESFACGVPVISTNVGGIAEFFPKNAGILVKKNEKELYAAMQKILEKCVETASKETLRTFAINDFSTSEIAKQYATIYESILK